MNVQRIWDGAPHNAFTDLMYHQNRWWCVFREGQGHVSPDGALRVITSRDGEDWESAALITSDNSDLRDAKLVATPDGQFMLCGAEAMHDQSEYRIQSLTWLSNDGVNWSKPNRVGDHDVWLWRATWWRGKAYGFGYGCRQDRRMLRLYATDDGTSFEVVVPDACPDAGYVNETSILFGENDTAYCLLRRDGEPNTALLGTACPPYTDWHWRDFGVQIGGPHMLQLPDGRVVAALRRYDGNVRTSLHWVDVKNAVLTEFDILPSGGDTSYAGLAWHDNQLWVSYYSSHEEKTAIYLARGTV